MDKITSKLEKIKQYSITVRIIKDDNKDNWFGRIMEFSGYSTEGENIPEVVEKLLSGLPEYIEEKEKSEYDFDN